MLVTGFDIIFFWVARMIMMTLKFTDQVPFKKVYVHGLVRDNDGQKMSKSKGNVLDPLDMIDGITLDALIDKRTKGLMQPQKEKQITKRTHKDFLMASTPTGPTPALYLPVTGLHRSGHQMGHGPHRRLPEFLQQNLECRPLRDDEYGREDCGVAADSDIELSLADRWIISTLQRAEQEVSDALDSFRFDVASHAAYEFIWNEYCDWYLELSKPVLWGDEYSAAQKRGTRRTLVTVLEAILRLAHPSCPSSPKKSGKRLAHWQARQVHPVTVKRTTPSCCKPFPASDAARIDTDAETGAEWVKAVISAVRNIRGEMGIPLGKALPIYLHNGKDSDQALLDANRVFLSKLAKLESITWLAAEDSAPPPPQPWSATWKFWCPWPG